MLTLNLSFKSLFFILRKFESCELPISPLISFHFLSPYKFCVNSIICCVLFAITITLSSIDPALILIFIPTLKKISSLPPQFKSGSLPIWPLDIPSFFTCTSCLNSTLCGIYILGSYTHLPPLLHPCPLLPLNPRDTYALAHMLILNLPIKACSFLSLLRIMPHLLHH
jgi:hypothetical protein